MLLQESSLKEEMKNHNNDQTPFKALIDLFEIMKRSIIDSISSKLKLPS